MEYKSQAHVHRGSHGVSTAVHQGQQAAHPEVQLLQSQFWQNAGHPGMNECADGDRKDKTWKT